MVYDRLLGSAGRGRLGGGPGHGGYFEPAGIVYEVEYIEASVPDM